MKNEITSYFSTDPKKGSLKISNTIIRSKKETNLLEAKIEFLALKKLDTEPITLEKKDNYGNFYLVDSVDINTQEIRMLTGRSGGSIYNDIKEVSISLAQKLNFAEDPEQKQYTIIPMYSAVTYNDGLLHIEYSNDASPYLRNVKTNYTNLSLPIMFSFETSGGFQLYKNLRTYTYHLKNIDMRLAQEDQPEVTKSYKSDELRVILGYIDLEQSDEIRKEANKPHPNWSSIESLNQKPMYKRWNDFKTRVIEPGVKEINKISDIYVTVEYVRTGKGAKVTEVIFHIQMNRKFYEAGYSDEEGVSVVTTLDEEVDVVKELMPTDTKILAQVIKMMSKQGINAVQAELLINEANGDIELISKAYELSKKQVHIENFMGWMRSAIKRNAYEDTTPIETVFGDPDIAKSRNSTAEKVWLKAQQDDVFPQFKEYVIVEYGDMSAFEILCDTPEKKFKEFADWKIKNSALRA